MKYRWTISAIIVLLACSRGFGVTSVQGFYELNYERLQELSEASEGGTLSWVKHYFELKFLGRPMPGVEAFIKAGSASEAISNPDRFHSWESHLSMNRFGLDAVLFSNEWRHSFSEYLLGLVSGRARGYYGRSQGMRVDLLERRGLRAQGMYAQTGESESSGNDDVYILGLQQRLGERADLGGMWLRRVWFDENHSPDSTFNQVFAGDVTLSAFDAEVTLEYAESKDPMAEKESEEDSWFDRRFSTHSAFKAEVRGLAIGPVSVLGHYRRFGKEFYDRLSDAYHPKHGSSFDQTGYFAQIVYFVPRKAITLTLRHDSYGTTFDPEKSKFWDEPYDVMWNQAEIFAEFKGGIKGKLVYELYENENPTRQEFKLGKLSRSALVEIQSENEVALVKFQVKRKDIGLDERAYGKERRFGERTLFGTEVKANLSDEWQVYSRMVLVDAKVDKWATLMAHVGYRISSTVEMWIEFGEPWRTDNDLVNDDQIANEIAEIKSRLFLGMKIAF
jgi:hypothetical protein